VNDSGALAVIILFVTKMAVRRRYPKMYNHVKIYGLLMAFLTFGMVGTSAGYYMLASGFGTDRSVDRILMYRERLAMTEKGDASRHVESPVLTDPEAIGRGKDLFDSKCRFCHHAYSSETLVGPGLKGILKNRRLPVSGRPATLENIARRLRKPFDKMPSFKHLTAEEVADIIAFLNTL
jgi:cytochrome c2